MAVLLRYAIQLRGQHFDLGGERGAHHQAPALVCDLLECRVGLGELTIAPRHPRFVLVAHEPAGRQRRELVAGRAVHRPRLRQALERREDLLDYDIQRLRLQALQVRLRIVQAIDMIDAQAVDHAALDQLEGEPVRAVEHARLVHAQRREVVDVEEAPVVDLVDRYAPVRQSIRLRVEQRVESIEAARIARRAVEPRDVASMCCWISGLRSSRRTSRRLCASLSR